MRLESSLPLLGKTVVVTRSQGQQAEARYLFETQGAKVLDLPALVIGPPDDWSPLDEALEELDHFHWIIFSSANGVNAVQHRLQLLGSSLSKKPKSLKIAVIGKKTARVLETYGICPDFIPPKFVADSLIDNFPVSAWGLRILLPRVQSGGRTLLADALGKAGARVQEVAAYESSCPKDIPPETSQAIINRTVNAIVFTSGKTAAHTAQLLKKFLGDHWLEKLIDIKLVSIGPQTTICCKKYFDRLDEEASNHDLDGLLEACIKSMID